MNILIVEDENLAAINLQKILQKLNKSINIVAVIQTITEFKIWVKTNTSVDLIFCDIELRDGNVLSFLKTNTISAPVVFTTAYDQFWQKALESNGIDYLLKPITEEKVNAVLAKVATLKNIFSGNHLRLIAELTDYMSIKKSKTYKKRFPVRINNEMLILEVEEVMFFRITNGVIFAYSAKDKSYPLSEQTLNDLEASLDPASFLRINRSEIVQLKFVDSIQTLSPEDFVIKLKNSNLKLCVSNSRIALLKNWIQQ